jgi:hypothetical protein
LSPPTAPSAFQWYFVYFLFDDIFIFYVLAVLAPLSALELKALDKLFCLV